MIHKFPQTLLISRKILVALVILLFLVSLLEIWLVNRLATYGTEISKIQYSAEGLKRENQVLKNQIDEQSSLTVNYRKAAELGFGSIKNVYYLKSQDIALNKQSLSTNKQSFSANNAN